MANLFKKFFKWFALETLGNWGYDQLGVLARSAIMTAIITFVVRSASTIPPDIWLILALFMAALLFFGLQRFIDKRRKGTKEFQVSGRTTEADAESYFEAHLRDIVEYQRTDLRKYVLVENFTVNSSPLADGKLYVEFAFHVRNYSMYYVSVPTAKGDSIKGSIHI